MSRAVERERCDSGNVRLPAGVDYSEWLTPNARQIATDNSGALYILSAFPISTDTPPSSVTKLSADGKTILWQNQLGFAVSTMAVDPWFQ